MKPLSLLASFALLLAATLPAAAREFKVATVNMRKLLNEFHETKAAEAESNVEREGIRKKDEMRMTSIKALQDELTRLRAEFQDPSLAVERRKKVAKQFAEREENLRMLGQEREEFLQRHTNAIKEKMADKMNDLRAKVTAAVQAYAATQDVDYVFDGSGITSTQVPLLLYVRKPVDITEGVLKALNKDAPAPPAKKPKSTE